ncbi:hypothetical protein PG997_005004 [Apiospora hydei]|uniref:Glutaredoxin-like protein n=1 Tax=Apiospora hydei TaxID=1337664 RepID=A0ABR1X3Q7_9PEZI
MRATTRLFQHATRITLFTRDNCGLCVKAKSILSEVKASRPFEYAEVDIIKDESIPRWRDLYEFDVPVIHVSKATAPKEDPKSASKALKLMHHLNAVDVQKKMDEAEAA